MLKRLQTEAAEGPLAEKVRRSRHARKTGSREEILVFRPVSSAALNGGSGADTSSSARSKTRSSNRRHGSGDLSV